MGVTAPIYPPGDLAKLDKDKRMQLREAIGKVLATDEEVRKLLHDKTFKLYEDLLAASSTPPKK
jgi:hypothetical protein